MNATEIVEQATAPRVSAHATCDHPKTKAARAACRRARRSGWEIVERGDELAGKGATLRVHVEDDMLEGTLLGWGAKRLVLRVDGQRENVATDDIVRVEARKGEDD